MRIEDVATLLGDTPGIIKSTYLHPVGELSIAEAHKETRREAEHTMGLKINAYVSDDVKDSISKAVNLLLYICSDAPDMHQQSKPSNSGQRKPLTSGLHIGMAIGPRRVGRITN